MDQSIKINVNYYLPMNYLDLLGLTRDGTQNGLEMDEGIEIFLFQNLKSNHSFIIFI